MKRNLFIVPLAFLTLAVCIVFCVPHAAGQGTAVIFRAMQDELERSMADLVMEDLERPYFLSYTIDDHQDLMIQASLGAIKGSTLDRGRELTVDLRVGDYRLDNSNFASGYSALRPSFSSIAVENDYDALRNRIYLATDDVYKNALRTLSKKRAYLQTRVMKNRPDDFFKLPANDFMDRVQKFDIDRDYFDDLLRAASEVLRDYPEINSSEVRLMIGIINQYLINSAGTKTLRGDRLYTVTISMSGRSEEGQDVRDAARIVVKDLKNLPDKKALIAWVKKNAERMKKLLATETIEEYAGPVILTEDAAGEFLRQLFAKNISNAPSPLFGNERMARMFPEPEFANKVKRRVLPAFFDVFCDPTVDRYGDLELVGGFEVDDAGGVPQRIQLVKAGKLINLPIGLAPTKKVKVSNGHARGAVSKSVTAKPSNLIFESGDKVSFAELKATMLEMCQDVDLEYGLVIRKLQDLNAPRAGMRFFGMPQGGEGALTAPLEVYKVYADGREEPVRNLEFSNVTVRVLRDIMQTGDQQYSYHYLIGNDYEMPVSIVCPMLLVEEMELKKSEEKIRRPPILPSPLAEK